MVVGMQVEFVSECLPADVSLMAKEKTWEKSDYIQGRLRRRIQRCKTRQSKKQCQSRKKRSGFKNEKCTWGIEMASEVGGVAELFDYSVVWGSWSPSKKNDSGGAEFDVLTWRCQDFTWTLEPNAAQAYQMVQQMFSWDDGNEFGANGKFLRPSTRPQVVEPASTPPPPEVVIPEVCVDPVIGSTIEVYWPSMQKWYPGFVDDFDSTDGVHLIVYFDEQQDRYPLLETYGKDRWKWKHSKKEKPKARKKRKERKPDAKNRGTKRRTTTVAPTRDAQAKDI